MTKETFRVLDEVEASHRRPEILLGTIEHVKRRFFVMNSKKEYKVVETEFSEGFFRLFEEAITNSIDEYERNDTVRSIKVEVQDSCISIEDDGGGYPLFEYRFRGVEKWAPEWILTKLYSGVNFNDDSRSTVGMNGVGISLVNFFSNKFTIRTKNVDSKEYLQTFEKHSTVVYEPKFNKGRAGSYTRIEFHPDFEKFKMKGIDSSYVVLFKEYVRNLSALYPKIRLTFNGERITCSKKEIYDAVLDDHVVYKSNKGEFAFGFSKTDKRDVIFVNSKQVSSFEKFDLFKSQTFVLVKNFLNKKHNLSVYLNTWFNENISAVVFLRGTNVRFRNQTKDVLVSYDSTEKEFLSEHPAKVATAFLKDKVLVERFLDFYSKKNHDEAKTKLKKAKNEFVEKLTEATGPIDEKILLICEGDSAKSVFNPVRNKDVHSILPMKGKPSNVFKLSLTEVVKNQEFLNIISSIHLGDRSHLRHSKAYIVSDADSDGLHIRILLVQFFVKFFSWFVEEGRLFVMEAPRYKYKLDGKVVYSTEKEPPDEAKNVEYYKGLGSMDRESVRHMLDNPKLIKIEDVEDLNSTYNFLYGNKELEEN